MQISRGLVERVLEKALCRVSEELYWAEQVTTSTGAEESDMEGEEGPASEKNTDIDGEFDTFEM